MLPFQMKFLKQFDIIIYLKWCAILYQIIWCCISIYYQFKQIWKLQFLMIPKLVFLKIILIQQAIQTKFLIIQFIIQFYLKSKFKLVLLLFQNLFKQILCLIKTVLIFFFQISHTQDCALFLRIIFEQIKRGQKLDLRENLKMDYRIVRRIMQGTDFFEGVKQVLVEKNHVSSWSFKDALTIPQSEVDKYFAFLVIFEKLFINQYRQIYKNCTFQGG
ncbi:unnamed protein product (macronuclear) [Paramecium tetraurelia]|uniref:Enoyl-CoA hydratase/isomerase domain-containing protein n=1 Tax=Paramecium tetraurelia TaxID=5888 RepID=A0D7T7_PARTE|nr:uncharacterized protein GSPATT00014071001 [Paramecium tetraurelia]CAK79104.1 unnamed protein product [Paramecium tetraurelia]|eukprot:XP_001446501.1 hypothetical protein (macronuclear) [Paramecium tetraurelia strain d4-2]